MYKFKYHPNNIILRDNGDIVSYADFILANPEFPIVEGEYFELTQEGEFQTIINGSHYVQDSSEYEDLISSINNIDIAIPPVNVDIIPDVVDNPI